MKAIDTTLAMFANLAKLALILLLAACQQATTLPTVSSPATGSSAAWDKYVDEFIESYFVAQPGLAVWAGRHEFDGVSPIKPSPCSCARRTPAL